MILGSNALGQGPIGGELFIDSSVDVAISGNSASVLTGVASKNINLALSGVITTTNTNSMNSMVGVILQLSGNQAAFSTGVVNNKFLISFNVNGNSSNTAVNSLVSSQTVNVPLTQNSIVSAAGNLSPPAFSLPVNNNLAQFSIGNVVSSQSISKSLTGNNISGLVSGFNSLFIDKPLSGNSISVSAGIVKEFETVSLQLSGNLATALVGTSVNTAAVSISVNGNSFLTGIGSISSSTAVSVSLPGNSASSTAGSLVNSSAVSIALSGNSSVVYLGLLVNEVQSNRLLSGNSSAVSSGVVTNSVAVDIGLLGVQSNVIVSNQNNFYWSDDLTNAVWQTRNANISKSGSEIAPSGQFANIMTCIGSYASVFQLIKNIGYGSKFTLDLEIKPLSGLTSLHLIQQGGLSTGTGRAYFNLSTGTITSNYNSVNTVTTLANGWLRITHTSSYVPNFFSGNPPLVEIWAGNYDGLDKTGTSYLIGRVGMYAGEVQISSSPAYTNSSLSANSNNLITNQAVQTSINSNSSLTSVGSAGTHTDYQVSLSGNQCLILTGRNNTDAQIQTSITGSGLNTAVGSVTASTVYYKDLVGVQTLSGINSVNNSVIKLQDIGGNYSLTASGDITDSYGELINEQLKILRRITAENNALNDDMYEQRKTIESCVAQIQAKPELEKDLTPIIELAIFRLNSLAYSVEPINLEASKASIILETLKLNTNIQI